MIDCQYYQENFVDSNFQLRIEVEMYSLILLDWQFNDKLGSLSWF